MPPEVEGALSALQRRSEDMALHLRTSEESGKRIVNIGDIARISSDIARLCAVIRLMNKKHT